MSDYATVKLALPGSGTTVHIRRFLPSFDELSEAFSMEETNVLCVADTHTAPFAKQLLAQSSAALCVLPPGETEKNWHTVEMILRAAREAGLGRDSLFIGIGGGVITDLTGFAASIYKRGARLVFVSTSLLGMVDAAVGGKTGFDLFGIKNFAGCFYPASRVYMPLETLRSLPAAELHSGYAELIKTLILDVNSDDETEFPKIKRAKNEKDEELLGALISLAVRLKGAIAEADPYDRDDYRALLNLGHTFGHALEAAAGLGALTHGEAVAWGIARSCDLGVLLGKTPVDRARAIIRLLEETGYEIRAPHPALAGVKPFMDALLHDKKKSGALFKFVVPARRGAQVVSVKSEDMRHIEDIVFRAPV